MLMLTVLITNFELWPPSGTVTYVRDLALELKRQGHVPIVFSSTAGEIADELRAAAITVTSHARNVGGRPDVIHGHHFAPTLKALREWPSVPAIHVLHDYRSVKDKTPLHPRIYRHLGVSRVCVERLIEDGAPVERVELLPNCVDTVRFAPRGSLPVRPRRALVFSNYAHSSTYLPAVESACAEAGLKLDIIGAGAGTGVAHPETLLNQYDIVFAVGKAAMEAMSVGAAVVLCDVGGAGPLVTADIFDELRPLNFGIKALRPPVTTERLTKEIYRYDARDAECVRDLVRTQAGLAGAVEALVGAYRAAIEEHAAIRTPVPTGPVDRFTVVQSLSLGLFWRWKSIPESRREPLKRVPGIPLALRATRRIFTPRNDAV
jgi:hypothetical protein